MIVQEKSAPKRGSGMRNDSQKAYQVHTDPHSGFRVALQWSTWNMIRRRYDKFYYLYIVVLNKGSKQNFKY